MRTLVDVGRIVGKELVQVVLLELSVGGISYSAAMHAGLMATSQCKRSERLHGGVNNSMSCTGRGYRAPHNTQATWRGG